jgi:hypothetical protein
MARLITTSSLVVLFVALVHGQAEAKSATGLASVYLYDQPVVCSAAYNWCQGAVPEALKSYAYLSTDSVGWPSLLVQLEVKRASGVVGRLEVVVPTGPEGAPRVTYSEQVDGQLVFQATRATGRVQLPPQQLDLAAATCGCTDGRLELLLVDAGPDGLLDTADDLVRRISHGLFSWSPATFCLTARVLDVAENIEVGPIDQCPTPTTSGSTGAGSGGGSSSGGGGSSGGVDVAVDYWDVDYGDGGCGGDDSDYEAEDCEGDSGGSDYDYGGDGCEGDSGGSADCAGDGGDCSGGDMDLGGGDCGGGGGGECAVGPRSRGGWFAQAVELEGGRSGARCRVHRHPIPTLPIVLAGLLLLHLVARATRRPRP